MKRIFTSLLTFILVLSMLTPFSSNVYAEQGKLHKPGEQSEAALQMKAAIAQQLNLANGGPVLHKDLRDLSGDEQIDVIVHLSETPVGLQKGINDLAGKSFTAAQQTKVIQKVTAQQANVKKEMKANQVSFKEGYTFNTVLNGFGAKVKADDLKKLLQIEGVTLIEPDAIVNAFEEAGTEIDEKSTKVDTDEMLETETVEFVTPTEGQVNAYMNTSIEFLGIEALWAEGYEGEGIKIAVLDTGIDADHPDFQGIYKGGKNFVPHTNNEYTRPRADNDASETSPAERPAHSPEVNASGHTFYTSHGTHVAGTIAAIGANEYGIKGIAPKVDLYAYRVLGAYGSGSTSGIVKAIDTAVIEGMDVINLSLGGGSNTETDSGSFAINNAMMAGTIAVVATGNSGPNRGTMGTPSTSRLGIAVGNTTNPEARYDGLVTVKAGDYEYSKQLNLMGTTFGKVLGKQLEGEFDLVAVPGVGKLGNYEGLNVDGKVVLVTRGEIPFVDKIAAAKEKGAVAIIVHNSVGGIGAPGPSGTVLGDAFEFIPTFDMSYTVGAAIRVALNEADGKVSFGNFNRTLSAGDQVNDSSSRGPSTPNFDIKPDVTAPGTNIMSTVPMYKADFPDVSYEHAYSRKTGTSMAAPHITGIAALIKQANPTWTPFDVKVALSNTAKVLDAKKYDVFAQGAGRVNAYAAVHPSILAYAIDEAVLNSSGEIVENVKGTVTFGTQTLGQDVEVTKEILVKDMKGLGGNYNVSVEVTKSFGDAKLTVDNPTFTLQDELTLHVTLTASARETKSGDELLGYIHIKGADASISLPFAVNFGPQVSTELKDLRITSEDLSFNRERTNENATLYFTITGDVGSNYIEVWDVMDHQGGHFGDGYIGYLHLGTSLEAGAYQLDIEGMYNPWDGSAATIIPDGVYTIDFTAKPKSGNPSSLFGYVGPLFVKSEAPVIEAEFDDFAVTGQVQDKYLVWNKAGFNYDINSKLFASYVISIDNEDTIIPIELAQDGSFDFNIEKPGSFDDITKAASVNLVVEDAAGNSTTTVLFERDAVGVTLTVNPVDLKLVEQQEQSIAVTETQTTSDGKSTVTDVTKKATYEVADNEIVTVTEGVVKALKAGKTTITVSYGYSEPVTIDVEVSEAPIVVPGPSTPPVVIAPGPSNPPVGVPPAPSIPPAPGKEESEDKPEVKPTKPPIFKDIANTFAKNEINALVGKGIIQGKTETNFAPNAQITRAEFAVLLARALDLPMKDYEGKFGDVNASKKWAFAGVEAAAHAGIVNGTTNGKFNPDAPIKREEIAAMVVRAIEYQNKEKLAAPDTPANFGDHGSIGTFAIDSVYKATAIGIIKGNNGQFMPKNNATRAEAAVMLYRALDALQLLD